MRVLFIIFVALAAALSGCSRSPVVTIANRSAVTISNVVVSGSGFAYSIGSIDAGKELKLTVRPSGKSALGVAFDAAGTHFDAGQQDYFEDGRYRIMATISTNFSVTVSVGSPSY
jgi:hypothetical protein